MDSLKSQTPEVQRDALQPPSLDALSEIPELTGPLGRALRYVDTLFVVLANAALLALAATVLLQISGRLFLPYSPAWTEELSRYLFVYMVALAAGVAIRRHRHVSVELYHHRLGPRTRAAYHVLISLAVGVFACIILPYAWIYAQNGAWQTSPALKVPMIYIFFSTVVLFALVLFYSVVGVVEGLIAMQRKPEVGSWK
ncbi:TRAP transporter small permease [Pseudomonas seleniipraecipitans]|uniref:TRAP transporter small permease protein n=1 Tax=Phytopseudomonas seleniipraecipitans TaxID=640205 RepID=A0ABY5J5C4_9GAMM|nr:TRAP transporter small permease [Pseudomonas seleniipraecipitans]UUD62741.1 TRAP transporter small permease [Pseudomonas seleniipraecipitans]